MKKIYLTVIGFSILCHLNALSQTKQDSVVNKPTIALHNATGKDSTQYNPRKLRLDEVDLFSSYYTQNGDHSAVTGGIGTEKVTDLSNGITLNFVWTNSNLNKNTLSAALGFDAHSSASQAYVSKTGASHATGNRLYPSLDWTVENSKTGNAFGLGGYISYEYNYASIGGDLHYALKTDDKNGEFSVKLQGYYDLVTLIYPSEFIPAGSITTNYGNHRGEDGHRDNLGTSPRQTYTASFAYSQIINSRLQVALLGDVVGQNGYLGLPFHRVYFSNGKDTIEKLPESRFKLPIGARLNYFLGDDIILRSYYRYFFDNWGIRSNTANLEVAYKISPFFSISPFYRYYTQTQAKYFAPYEGHSPTDQYYTSNYEFSNFNSQFFGLGIRLAPPKGVFGWQNLHELEFRYGHYSQTTDLVSDVFSVSLGFK